MLWSGKDDEYLSHFREEFQLDSIIDPTKDELSQVLQICNWVHNQWQHDGWNTPTQNDPAFILREVKQGRRFRCVEYSIVIQGVLSALGFTSRVLGLMTEDCETRESSAGHIVAEVYLEQYDKWVLVDGQFNSIPLLENIPLSALELQEALAAEKNVKIVSLSKTEKNEYLNWIFPYLFYYWTYFDQRVGTPKRETYNGFHRLMLVPLDAKNPNIFQRTTPINDVSYTHDRLLFYRLP